MKALRLLIVSQFKGLFNNINEITLVVVRFNHFSVFKNFNLHIESWA